MGDLIVITGDAQGCGRRDALYMCVCVCVCERERETESEKVFDATWRGNEYGFYSPEVRILLTADGWSWLLRFSRSR